MNPTASELANGIEGIRIVFYIRHHPSLDFDEIYQDYKAHRSIADIYRERRLVVPNSPSMPRMEYLPNVH